MTLLDFWATWCDPCKEELPDYHKLLDKYAGKPFEIVGVTVESGSAADIKKSVDELKIYKPAPQVYELAVQRLRVAKERIGFVSSNCWDALGAKSYGFTVYWINRGGAPLDALGFKPDAELRSLAELPDEVLR